MDAAIPADAQNAPTGIWKSRTEREIPTAPTPIIVVVNERKNNGDSNSVAKPSTESDQAHCRRRCTTPGCAAWLAASKAATSIQTRSSTTTSHGPRKYQTRLEPQCPTQHRACSMLACHMEAPRSPTCTLRHRCLQTLRQPMRPSTEQWIVAIGQSHLPANGSESSTFCGCLNN